MSMPKSKSKRTPIRRLSPAVVADPRQRGLHAFQAGRFAEAIVAWTPLAARDPAARAALAEAHFRRALATPPLAAALDDLRRAVELAPEEPRYHFHLGRYLHKSGDLAAASEQYRAVLERDSAWAGAAKLLALAALEQNPRADLAKLPGFSPTVAQLLAPAQALLRGAAVPDQDETPVGHFWRGLARVAAGDAAAGDVLADERSLPSPTLNALRRYYRGLAAARAGDLDTTQKLWQRALEGGSVPARLRENLVVLLFDQLTALVDAGDSAGAAALAQRSLGLPGNAAFDQLRLLALDNGAAAAAVAGDWPRAAELWQTAREIVSSSPSLGSPQPLLHNLALAYERLERWEAAADAWRAMLRTRPRRKATGQPAAAAAALSDQQWAWVRTRIITCYQRAGRPDLALAVFRQIIKEDPNDLDVRVQLADALLANEQARAAENEIGRVLQIDPHHVEALLRHMAFIDTHMRLPESEQIMRDILARNPERADLRRIAGEHFLEHGRQYAQWGNTDTAYNLFVEGERYDPENYLLPLNQARMQIGRRPHEEVRALVERATALVGDHPEAYVKILETWVIADRIDEARALLDQLATDQKLDVRTYVDFGLMVITRVTPPPAPLGMFAFLNVAPPPPPAPTNTPWTQLASELLDRAMALRPDDVALRMAIASTLMISRPDLAGRYIESAAQLAPDNPDTLIMLGMIQGLNEQVKEAKATLQRAAQLARKQGQRELVQRAQEMRGLVGTPMLRSMLQMSLLSAELGGIDGEFDDDGLDLDSIEGFF
jgi:tetratricopeptide (TPR) repeat protein